MSADLSLSYQYRPAARAPAVSTHLIGAQCVHHDRVCAVTVVTEGIADHNYLGLSAGYQACSQQHKAL